MRKFIWTFAIAAMAMISCSKQEDEGGMTPPSDKKEDVTYLKINSVTATTPTRAAIKDTYFPTEDEVSIGLFVVGDGYTDAKYSNIKYTKPAGSNKFTDPQIALVDGKTATVYAYYPYDANISNVNQIPIASSVCGDDWMWTTPVTEVSTTKPSIDLILNHALALVEITFNIVGPAGGTMTNVTVAGGAGAFSKAGTMDATNGGALTPDAGQMATTTSPFSQDVNLSMTDGKIIADCLLVPGKSGDDADARQDFYIKCTYNGKTLSASLTGDKGVIVRKNTKSTVSLNIKDNKLEVVSVGVEDWDNQVSGNTATIDGHTVTFNCPEGLKYDLSIESRSTAISGETTDAEKPMVIFRYDISSIPDYRFVFNGSVSSCTVSHDWQNGIITIKDVTDNVTVNLGFGTYIPYTATAKVEPKDKTAFGSPYDEARSTFSNGSGVVAIDGEIETIGRGAFDGCTSLTGVDLSGCKKLKTLKEYAFNACTHLTSVKLPEGLETIELNVFWHMGKDVTNEEDWKPLELPSTLSTIGQYTFEDSRFTSVTLPAALKTVGTDIFKYSSVKTLTIEDGAVLSRKMFNSCFQLTTIICKSTTPPNMKADDGLFAIANEYGNTALTNIQNIYVPASSVDAYKSAPGWEMYKDKVSAIPTQN